jgi:uncharacterized sulfatase
MNGDNSTRSRSSETPVAGSAARAKRDTLFGEVFLHTAIDIDKPAANLRFRWVIQGNRKLILPNAANEPGKTAELYDLAKDPHETENLAAKHPERVTAMKDKLDAWWKPH